MHRRIFRHPAIRSLSLALIAGFGLAAMAPAQAEDWHHGRDRDWHHDHGWGVGYVAPPVIYAAPPVYAPPPVVYGAPAISLGVRIGR